MTIDDIRPGPVALINLPLIRCRRNRVTGRGVLILDRPRGRRRTAPSSLSAAPGVTGELAGELSVTATAPRPRITIFTRCYPPAYLAGGPARSLHGLVETLAADFRFSVVTSALDGPADRPMESVQPDRWSRFGHATTWYELSRRRRTWKTVTLLRQTRPQVVYLNSLFDYRFSVLPLLLTRVTSRRTPVLLAPRGELSAGALGLKRWKKRLFLAVFRLLRLHKTVTWHASTGLEQADIERTFGQSVRSQIAVNVRASISCAGQDRADHATGTPGGRSLVFMSRIVPKKNVATLIRALPLVEGGARLSIAGPIEDVRYWAKCTELIGGLDDPDMARYVGTVPPDQAVSFLGGFDLFVLPTWGENFGHVVLESLAAGTPVIVGRDSPWHRVEPAGAGWLCDPASPAEVAGLIQRFLDLDEESRGRMRQAACRVADQVQNNPEKVEVNRAMFRALTRGVPG